MMAICAILVAFFGLKATAQDSPQQILFTNVKVFNGTDNALQDVDVLVEGNLIKQLAKGIKAPKGAQVIDGGGRTLMPGIVEAHSHLMMSGVNFTEATTGLPGYNTIQTTLMARDMLMNGVTTTRDMGGEVFTTKRAIDEGLIPGPRIYPSGAMISQTSGHADFRKPYQENPEFGAQYPLMHVKGATAMVDGVPRMLTATREQLRHGASQVKLAVGGSVSGPYDPIDTKQFLLEEIEAAVKAAEGWGTYVTVHGYTVAAVNQALDAGVKCVEHGQLLDRATLERMAKEGIWLSIQPFTECHEASLSPAQNEKQAIVCQGTAKVYELIKELPDLKVVHGTDIFVSPGPGIGVSKEVEQMKRLLKWFSPFEILKMSTGNATELLQLSGPRNPYPGVIGRIQEGALADLLVVNGNPLEDLKAVTDRDNIRIIMKDGKVYKNTLD